MKHPVCLALVAVLVTMSFRPASAIVFVHLSDTHVNVTGKGRYSETSIAALRRAVEAIRIIKPDFVICTGDITESADEASMKVYRAEIEKACVPVYTVQGNHDRARVPDRFNRAVGPTHPVFDMDGCRFVGLNLDLADEAFALLEEQLADANTKGIRSVFTFAHYPLVGPDVPAFNISAGIASLRGDRAMRYLNLARSGVIVAHFSGHLHSTYEIADPYTGVLSLSVPGCVDRKSALRVCSVKDGVLSWSVANASSWPIAVLESVTPHVQWGTAHLKGKVPIRMRTFGPEPIREAALSIEDGPALPLTRTADGTAFEGVLDCAPLKSNYYNLKARLVDVAGNASNRTWRVLIKGGK